MKGLIVLCALAGLGRTQPPGAAEIMVRVAENQDRAQEMRASMVYNQNLLIRMKRGNGKLAREEIRDFTVIPTATGIKKDLVHFTGKYENKGKWVEYSKPGFEYKQLDIDGSLIKDLANDLTDDHKSRDGISADLFPLTRKQQEKYIFELKGRENYRDNEVYRITFEPKKASLVDFDDGECSFWAGEALVDVREYQPVLVTTWAAKKIPLAVRTLLGTDIRHIGFKVAYRKFDEGLWFPVSYGGEFYVRAVFFYRRTFALSLSNSGFQRAEVKTQVAFGDPVKSER